MNNQSTDLTEIKVLISSKWRMLWLDLMTKSSCIKVRFPFKNVCEGHFLSVNHGGYLICKSKHDL